MFDYFLYRVGQWIVLHLSRRAAYRVATWIADIRYVFAFDDHRQVRDNLRVIFPHKSSRALRVIRRNMAHNFAKHLVDFFTFARVDEDFIRTYVRIENRHFLDAALARKKGVVALTAHLGGWEVGGAILGALGYPVWAVALTHKHPKVNEFFNQQRQFSGVRVVQLGYAYRACLKAIRAQEIVGLVGDRNFIGKGVVLDFFGKDTLFPEGPAALAVKCQAAIVPGFVIRQPDDSFVFRFEKPIISESSGDDEQDVRRVISAYARVFETYIRQFPDQWFLFKRFWKQ